MRGLHLAIIYNNLRVYVWLVWRWLTGGSAEAGGILRWVLRIGCEGLARPTYVGDNITLVI